MLSNVVSGCRFFGVTKYDNIMGLKNAFGILESAEFSIGDICWLSSLLRFLVELAPARVRLFWEEEILLSIGSIVMAKKNVHRNTTSGTDSSSSDDDEFVSSSSSFEEESASSSSSEKVVEYLDSR
ncbi:uncharacterized protein OCT59_008723 [Rhizophagus irregularis]|uniref:uncharacterized protein n=1 Tax=Rhizophagus irregularis TaxID=588596 RepID=UPI00332905A2|nr:hypothetical protein OCT59_008723 [Rhizophagus irregularis]